jgi:hypothetical protein
MKALRGCLLCSAVLLIHACSTKVAQTAKCGDADLSGTWVMNMNGNVKSVSGKVRFASDSGFVDLTATSRSEGWGELMQYPIRGFRIAGDSVMFSFASIGFELKGRCIGRGRVAGAYLMGSGMDSGDWVLERPRERR